MWDDNNNKTTTLSDFAAFWIFTLSVVKSRVAIPVDLKPFSVTTIVFWTITSNYTDEKYNDVSDFRPFSVTTTAIWTVPTTGEKYDDVSDF